MSSKVQTRLDPESQEALDRLARRFGWSRARVVREAIQLMARHHGVTMRRKLIGIGMYDSGMSDLATNKKHMENFGRARQR